MTNTQQTADQVRAQFQVKEETAQHVIQAATDLTVATTSYGLQAYEQGLHYATDLRNQGERMANETFQAYRRVYEDGLRSWQNYVQGVTEIMSRKI